MYHEFNKIYYFFVVVLQCHWVHLLLQVCYDPNLYCHQYPVFLLRFLIETRMNPETRITRLLSYCYSVYGIVGGPSASSGWKRTTFWNKVFLFPVFITRSWNEEPDSTLLGFGFKAYVKTGLVSNDNSRSMDEILPYISHWTLDNFLQLHPHHQFQEVTNQHHLRYQETRDPS